MRVVFTSPRGLLRGHAAGLTPAGAIHGGFARYLWRGQGIGGRATALLLLAIAPLGLALLAGAATARHGRVVAARRKKPMLRQLIEQLAIAWCCGVLPEWYYIFDLYEPGRLDSAGDYLLRHELKAGLYGLLKFSLREIRPAQWPRVSVSDKLAFTRACLAAGLPVIPIWLALDRGRQVFPDSGGGFPDADLFLKRTAGRGGIGAERWEYDGAGGWRGPPGVRLDRAGLVAHVARLSQREPYLVQPRLVTRSDLRDLSGAALSTIRVMSCINEAGAFEVTDAVFRMSRGEASVVDNFHAGGIAAAVDLATGTLGRATDLRLGLTPSWCERHPDSGGRILGRRQPLWPEVLALVARAHAVFDSRAVIGWDIALTDAGPVIVEANGAPDVDILQRTQHRPLGNERLGQIIAFHLERALARRLPARVGRRHPVRVPRAR
jgi:hypothetical protein